MAAYWVESVANMTNVFSPHTLSLPCVNNENPAWQLKKTKNETFVEFNWIWLGGHASHQVENLHCQIAKYDKNTQHWNSSAEYNFLFEGYYLAFGAVGKCDWRISEIEGFVQFFSRRLCGLCNLFLASYCPLYMEIHNEHCEFAKIIPKGWCGWQFTLMGFSQKIIR